VKHKNLAEEPGLSHQSSNIQIMKPSSAKRKVMPQKNTNPSAKLLHGGNGLLSNYLTQIKHNLNTSKAPSNGQSVRQLNEGKSRANAVGNKSRNSNLNLNGAKTQWNTAGGGQGQPYASHQD
jgi:hypothetical protein